MRGTLFTQDFLERGVAETPQWRNLDEGAFRAFQEAVVEIYRRIRANSTINEATTESEIIFPVIEALGWTDYLPQQTASRSGREDVPDALLFPNATAKAAALKKRKDEARYPYGLTILESKRWRRALDRGLKDLFRFINEGETSIGMPPYNGGLFDDAPHPVLARATIPDAELAPLIDRLSRWEGNGERRWINCTTQRSAAKSHWPTNRTRSSCPNPSIGFPVLTSACRTVRTG